MAETIIYNSDGPVLSIIISTFKRLGRLNTCLQCLYSSILFFNKNVQIIIMDSSPDRSIKDYLLKFSKYHPKLINLIYSYCRGFNQSQLRNHALNYIPDVVKYILVLDSDIYLNKETINRCIIHFSKYKNVTGIGVPIYSYNGGRHIDKRSSLDRFVKTGCPSIIMPNLNDYQEGIYEYELLSTKLLRGAFFIKKEILTTHFGSKPWLEAFTVWQNVPFFLTLKELNLFFGYTLDESTSVLHDERPNLDTIRSSMINWHAETIKSILLLFYRNHLWKKTQQKLNERFVEVMKPILTSHLEKNVEHILNDFYLASYYLNFDEQEGKKGLSSLLHSASDSYFNQALALLISSNWNLVKEVVSNKLDLTM